MFFKHRFFLSTIAFFARLPTPLHTTAYPSPHGFISPLLMDSFLLSARLLIPLRMDSFPLSARLPTPLHTEHLLFFWYIQQTRKRKIHLPSHNCYGEYFTSQ